MELAGLGAVGTAVALGTQHDEGLRGAANWVALGGAAALVTGAILTANAASHTNDAVNAYNDGVVESAETATSPEIALDPQ